MDRPTFGIPRDADGNWIRFNCTDWGFAERMLFWDPGAFRFCVARRRFIVQKDGVLVLGSPDHLEILTMAYQVVKAMDEERSHPDFPYAPKEFDKFRHRCGMLYG